MGQNLRTPISRQRLKQLVNKAAHVIDRMKEEELDEYVGTGGLFKMFVFGSAATHGRSMVLHAYDRLSYTHRNSGLGSYGHFLDATLALSAGHHMEITPPPGMYTPLNASIPDMADTDTGVATESKTSIQVWRNKDDGGLALGSAKFGFAPQQLIDGAADVISGTVMTIPRTGDPTHMFFLCTKDDILDVRNEQDGRRAATARPRMGLGYDLTFPVNEDGTLRNSRSIGARLFAERDLLTTSATKQRERLNERLNG